MSKKSKPPVALYSALADTTRCRIVEILLSGPIPVHTLADSFSISRPAISRHLRVLKTAGLVVEVKKGRENLYTLRAQKLDAAKTWIETIRPRAGAEPASVAPAAEEPVVIQPEPKPVKPAKPKPWTKKPESTVEVAPASPEPKTAKSKKPAPEPELDLSQMGFDF